MKIMFWSDSFRPENYVREDVPLSDRELAALILKSGKSTANYRGMAHCRIKGCGQLLGSQDLAAYGFTWPSRAEHYVLKHNVWVPEMPQLIAAYRSEVRNAR